MFRDGLLDRKALPATSADEEVGNEVDPALAIVDHAIATYAARSLVSGQEVVDFLLDIRNALSTEALLRQLVVHELTT